MTTDSEALAQTLRNVQTGLEHYARAFWATLDPQLEADVLVVAIDGSEKGNPVVAIIPGDRGYDISLFASIPAEVRSAAEELNEHDTLHDLQAVLVLLNYALLLTRSWPIGVMRALKNENLLADKVFFASKRITIGGIDYFILLTLPEGVVRRYPTMGLPGRHRPPDGPSSLIEAIARSLVRMGSDHLRDSIHDGHISFWRPDRDSILKTSSGMFMIMKNSPDARQGWMGSPLRDIDRIASLNYEAMAGRGRMLILPDGHPGLEYLIRFQRGIPLSNGRAARKALQLAAEPFAVVTRWAQPFGFELCGVARFRPVEAAAAEEYSEILFKGPHTWELHIGGQCHMIMSYGTVFLPRPAIDEERFKEVLMAKIAGGSEEAATVIWRLAIDALATATHGTMIVIANDAESEATRLSKQCIQIEPRQLDTDLLRAAAGIDGAILVDSDATCYAIGVILDGIASGAGDPGRGARYNSAVRYITTSAQPRMAIVISEDGTIDTFPDTALRWRYEPCDPMIHL